MIPVNFHTGKAFSFIKFKTGWTWTVPHLPHKVDMIIRSSTDQVMTQTFNKRKFSSSWSIFTFNFPIFLYLYPFTYLHLYIYIQVLLCWYFWVHTPPCISWAKQSSFKLWSVSNDILQFPLLQGGGVTHYTHTIHVCYIYLHLVDFYGILW